MTARPEGVPDYVPGESLPAWRLVLLPVVLFRRLVLGSHDTGCLSDDSGCL